MKKFGALFVAPLLHHRSPQQSVDDFLETSLFHKDERIIIRCHAKRAFVMPGEWLVCAERPSKYGAPRRVKRRQNCFVRFDRTDKQKWVEIETYIGQGFGKEYVFKLTPIEWTRVKNDLYPTGKDKPLFDLIGE